MLDTDVHLRTHVSMHVLKTLAYHTPHPFNVAPHPAYHAHHALAVVTMPCHCRFVVFGLVLAYYTERAVIPRVSGYIHASTGLFTAFVACGFLESLWERDEAVEAATVATTVLILIGQHDWHVSRAYGGNGQGASSRGNIIG